MPPPKDVTSEKKLCEVERERTPRECLPFCPGGGERESTDVEVVREACCESRAKYYEVRAAGRSESGELKWIDAGRGEEWVDVADVGSGRSGHRFC